MGWVRVCESVCVRMVLTSHPCIALLLRCRLPLAPILFRQQRGRCHTTCNGRQHFPLSDPAPEYPLYGLLWVLLLLYLVLVRRYTF